MQMSSKLIKKSLVSLASRDMKAKSTSRFHHQNDNHKENKSKTKLKQT